MRWLKAVEAICAVLLVVITGLYTHFARLQAIAAIESSHAATKSADAARTAAQIADKSLRISERAFLYVEQGQVDLDNSRGFVEIRNSGSTPAYQVRQHTVASIQPYPLPVSITGLEKLGNPTPTGRGTLNPHGGFGGSWSGVRHFTQEELESIKDGKKKRLVIWGGVTYKDIFGELHHVNYCHIHGGQATSPL